MTSAGGRVVLVKLGGSLVTEKGRDATPREATIERLAGEIARARGARGDPLVLGHGSGSFGHPPAARHGLRSGLDGPDSLRGLATTQARAVRLHRLVVDALRDAGVPTFSVAPSSAAVARDGVLEPMALEPLVLALEWGLVPVTHGDVVADRTRGATIASTEEVFARLARDLPERGWRVTRVLWLGDAEGVLDASGTVVPEIRAGGPVPDGVGGAMAPDVTGGMAHRVEIALELAELGVASWIGDGAPGRLEAALAGDVRTGTRVPASGGA